MSDERPELRLCLVKHDWAWFTSQPVEAQWGDDWDDAPYEHNAGAPYEWAPDRGVPPYTVVCVAYSGSSLAQPGEGVLNSRWSVEMVNRRETPWLQPDSYGAGVGPRGDWRAGEPEIWAGTALRDFVRIVLAAGGMVYLPVDLEYDTALPAAGRQKGAIGG